MSNDRNNGNGSGGRAGDGGDSVDGFAGHDDATVVIVTDRYTRESIERLGRALRRAAERCDRLGELGNEAAHEDVVDIVLLEIEEDMTEVQTHAAGSVRAIRRFRAARQRERAAPKP